MRKHIVLLFLLGGSVHLALAQDVVSAANRFVSGLSAAQQLEAVYPFDADERFNFHYIPRERKGIAFGDLNPAQQSAAMALAHSCLSAAAVQRFEGLLELEKVLKAIEGRSEDDHYRDPRKYYFTVFGVPGGNTTWGWRLEGHHISFNFSVKDGKIVSGTPAFIGSNPAIVKSGPQQGKQLLKDETELGFAMVGMLSGQQLQSSLLAGAIPGEIITAASRKASLEKKEGLRYADMSAAQKAQLLTLIKCYVYRFTKLFADDMLKAIQAAGLDEIRFAWAGPVTAQEGKAYYYRVQGPGFIIEYDNSQNNANHVHTVMRDLQHDFGGDELLEHYRTSHQ